MPTYFRRPTKSPELPFDSGGQDKDKKAERDLLRQQAENLVQVSYQSLRDAMFQQGETDQADQADETVPEPDETQPAQLQLRREASERHNTAQWLCDLVFSSYVESLSGNLPTPSRGDKSDAEAGPGGPGGSGHTDGAFGMELSTSVSSIPERMQLATIIQTPVEVPTVVVELLAEWTTLTENEIAGVVEAEPVRLEPEFPSGIINFEDALGRKWKFPYQKCQTWAVSSELQKQDRFEAYSNVPLPNYRVSGIWLYQPFFPLNLIIEDTRWKWVLITNLSGPQGT